MIWKKMKENVYREWKLTTVDPQEKCTWRSGVRSATRTVILLPGRGALMCMMQLQAYQTSDNMVT